MTAFLITILVLLAVPALAFGINRWMKSDPNRRGDNVRWLDEQLMKLADSDDWIATRDDRPTDTGRAIQVKVTRRTHNAELTAIVLRYSIYMMTRDVAPMPKIKLTVLGTDVVLNAASDSTRKLMLEDVFRRYQEQAVSKLAC